MKIRDRVRLAIAPKNSLMEVLEKYAQDFLAGDDKTIPEGMRITSKNAMGFSAVFACNRILSETLASCPIMLYEKDENGNRKKISDCMEYEVLHYAPNPDMTPFQFKEFGMTNINLGGNFIAQKIFNLMGEVIEIRPIAWERVRIDIEKGTGRLLYFIDGSREPKLRDEILHIPGLTLDGYIGITPLSYTSLTIDIGISQDRFERNFYHNRASTSGIFEYPNELGEDAFKRLKKDIKKNYTGLSNAGVPMILEGGGKFKEITMKLTDAQFLESKRFRIEDVCRIFRIPLHLVQDLTRSTNNNIEHQSLEFIMYTMLPWFKRWEENLNLQLLSRESRRRNRYFEFNISGLLRGDVKSRYDAYARGRQWGWLSVNDIRRLENLNPISNGDIYLEPLNMKEAGKREESFNSLREDIINMIDERK